MNHRTVTLCSATLILSPCVACREGYDPALAPHAAAATVRVLATLGASDVTGVGAAPPREGGWPERLAELLPGEQRLIKLGQPGWTAQAMRKHGLGTIVSARPDTIVLWLGVNDLLAGRSLAAFERDLDALLETLTKTGARTFLVGFPPLGRLPAVRASGKLPAATVSEWQRAIERAGRHHGAALIELEAYGLEWETHPEYISSDGFHPSRQGYSRLAQIMAEGILARTPTIANALQPT